MGEEQVIILHGENHGDGCQTDRQGNHLGCHCGLPKLTPLGKRCFGTSRCSALNQSLVCSILATFPRISRLIRLGFVHEKSPARRRGSKMWCNFGQDGLGVAGNLLVDGFDFNLLRAVLHSFR